MQQQQHAQVQQLASIGAPPSMWGANSALGLVAAGAVAAVGIVALSRR